MAQTGKADTGIARPLELSQRVAPLRWLAAELDAEHERWFLWLPVLFGMFAERRADQDTTAPEVTRIAPAH